MNKGRQKDKGKRAALIRQAIMQSGMKWPIKKKEHMVGKKRKRGTTTTLFSEKKEEAGNVSEQRVKG